MTVDTVADPIEVQVASYVINIESWTALPHRIKIIAQIERFDLFKATTIILYKEL